MFNYISTKIKGVLCIKPQKSFQSIKTIRDNGTFGLFVYNSKMNNYVEISNIDLLNCDESYITRTLQICNNIQTSSRSTSVSTSTSTSTSTSSSTASTSSSSAPTIKYFYGWGTNKYNQITKSLLNNISITYKNSEIIDIASGMNFNLIALRTQISEGNYVLGVYGWGDNRFGQIDSLSSPSDTGISDISEIFVDDRTTLNDNVKIACGAKHIFIITENKLLLHGNNDYMQCELPEGTTRQNDIAIVHAETSANAFDISCGYYHTLAFNKVKKILWCWGDTRFKQTTIPSHINQASTQIKQIICGGYHSVVLYNNGLVHGWGKNNYGQCYGTDSNNLPLTNDTSTDYVKILGNTLNNVQKIVAGENHTCALLQSGSVRCWGDNSKGQCNVPTTLFDAINVYAYGNTTIAIRKNGSIVIWGDVSNNKASIPPYAKIYSDSKLSMGTNHFLIYTNKTSEEVADTLPPENHLNQYVSDYYNYNIVRVYQSYEGGHNLGLSIGTDENNEIISYMPENYIRRYIGQNTTDSDITKIKDWITFPNTVSYFIGSGKYTNISYVEQNAYDIFTPGENRQGVFAPYVKINNEMLKDVIELSSGDGFIVALKSDKTAVAWGRNDKGQCVVPSVNNIKNILCIENKTYALLETGNVIKWGDLSYTLYDELLSKNNIDNIEVGKDHLLLLHKNGTLSTIVKNTNPYLTQLTNIPKRNEIMQLSGGLEHIAVLKSNRTVVCWGENNNGRCSVPSNLTNVIEVAAGGYFTAALKENGEVVVWGSGDVTNVPISAKSGVIKIAAGPDYILALKDDHTVLVWPDEGRGIYSRLPNKIKYGEPRTSISPDVISISAGAHVACVGFADTTMMCWGPATSTLDNNDSYSVLCGRGKNNDLDYPWSYGDNVKKYVTNTNTTRTWPQYPTLDVDGISKITCHSYYPTEPVGKGLRGTLTISHGQLFAFGESLEINLDGTPATRKKWEQWQEDGGDTKQQSSTGYGRDLLNISYTNKRAWFIGEDYKIGVATGNYDDLFQIDWQTNIERIQFADVETGNILNLANLKVEQLVSGNNYIAVIEKDTKKLYVFASILSQHATIKNKLSVIPNELKNTAETISNIIKIKTHNNTNYALNNTNQLYVWGDNTYYTSDFPEYFYVKDFIASYNKIVYFDINNNLRMWGTQGEYKPPIYTNRPGNFGIEYLEDGGKFYFGLGISKFIIPTDIYYRKLCPQLSASDKFCPKKCSSGGCMDSSDPAGRSIFTGILSNGRLIGNPYNSELSCIRKRYGNFVEEFKVFSDTHPNVTYNQLAGWLSSRTTKTASPYIPFLLKRNDIFCIAGKVIKFNSFEDVYNPPLFSSSLIENYEYHMDGKKYLLTEDKLNKKRITTNFTRDYSGVYGYESLFWNNFSQITATIINSKDQNLNKTEPLGTAVSGYSVAASRTPINNEYSNGPGTRTFSFEPIPIGGGQFEYKSLWLTRDKYFGRFTDGSGNTESDDFKTKTIKWDVGWDGTHATFLGVDLRKMTSDSRGPFNGDTSLRGLPYRQELGKCGTYVWVIGNNSYGQVAGRNLRGEQLKLYTNNGAPESINYWSWIGLRRGQCCTPNIYDPKLYTVGETGYGDDRFVTTRLYCAREISCGLNYSCIADEFGSVVCWGRNDTNQCNVPSIIGSANNKKAIDVKCGPFHSCAVLIDGSVVCWGNNKIDQLEVPSSLNNVVSIACGAFHTCALKSDGTVVCWGNNRDGQCDVPRTLNNVKKITCGYNHSIALRSDGKVVAWGDNMYGQCLGSDINGNAILKTPSNLGDTIKGSGIEITNIVDIFGTKDKTFLLRENATEEGELIAFGLEGEGIYKKDQLPPLPAKGSSWLIQDISNVYTGIKSAWDSGPGSGSPGVFQNYTGCINNPTSGYYTCTSPYNPNGQTKCIYPKNTWIPLKTLSTTEISLGKALPIDQLKINMVMSLVTYSPSTADNGFVSFSYGQPEKQKDTGGRDIPNCFTLANQAEDPILTSAQDTISWPGESFWRSELLCLGRRAKITAIDIPNNRIKLNKDVFLTLFPQNLTDSQLLLEVEPTTQTKPIYVQINNDLYLGKRNNVGLGTPYLIDGVPAVQYPNSTQKPKYIHIDKTLNTVTWMK